MEARTERKLKAATQAVDALFSDTSIPRSETVEALEELQADVEGKLDALKGELAGGKD